MMGCSPSMRHAQGVVRARCPNNTAHLRLMACALLLTTSALGQQTPALDGGTRASRAPLTPDDLPSIPDCWGLVATLFADAAMGVSAGDGGRGSGSFSFSSDDIPFCTVDDTDYDRCCEPVAFFSMGSPGEGCLCIDTFLVQMGPVVYDIIEPMVGLDLDFYFWAGKQARAQSSNHHRRSIRRQH